MLAMLLSQRTATNFQPKTLSIWATVSGSAPLTTCYSIVVVERSYLQIYELHDIGIVNVNRQLLGHHASYVQCGIFMWLIVASYSRPLGLLCMSFEMDLRSHLQLVLLDTLDGHELGLEDYSDVRKGKRARVVRANQCHLPRTLLAGMGPIDLLPYPSAGWMVRVLFSPGAMLRRPSSLRFVRRCKLFCQYCNIPIP